MASECEASCENDPNFAVICAFMEKFGKQCGLPAIDFLELQQMLENTDEVPPALNDLIIKVLRKIRKAVKPDKWEKSLVTVAHTFNSVDAWEIERFGYKKAKLSSKVRVLKEILEMQFDYNIKFKNEINKVAAIELRSQPLGRDKAGHAYWFHSDDNCQIRIYKEDLDDETWKLIAKDRESLVSLISKLNDGDTKFSSDSAVNEDSNSLSDKPLIDTGQTESKNENNEENKLENNEDSTSKNEIDDIIEDDNCKKENGEVMEEENSNKKSSDATKDDKGEKENTEPVNKKSSGDTESKSNEPVRPMLRIKKLSELMGTDVKRPKLDDNCTESEDKVHITDSKKNTEVGETIIEPVMRIEGEGNGKDNESINDRSSIFSNICEVEMSPIIGEEIEEETFYVYGEGLGQDSQTGNDEKEQSNEKNGDSSVSGANSSDSVDNSIKSTVCELEDNNPNEVPLNKIDAVIEENKTENKLDSENMAKSSEADVRTENSDVSQNENCISGTKSPVPKKSMFFFGSPLKNTSFSPSAKVEFGQISPKTKEVCEVSTNSENNNEVTDKDEMKLKPIDSPIQENSQSADEVVCQENNSEVTLNEKDDVQAESVSQSSETDSTTVIDIPNQNQKALAVNTKKGTDDEIETCVSNKAESQNLNAKDVNDKLVEVKEDPCVKKIAYQCGAENKEDPQIDSSKVSGDTINNGVEEVCTKKVAYTCGEKEDSNVNNENAPKLKDKVDENKSDIKQTLNKPQLKVELLKHKSDVSTDLKKVEVSNDDSKKEEKPQITQTANKADDNSSKINKTPNITKTTTTIRDDQLHKSLRYFRTRRTANVRPTVNPVKVEVKTDTSSLAIKKTILGASVTARPRPSPITSQKVSTEVVYLQDRKIKGKKEREIIPAAIQKNNKKPKLISGDVDQLSKKGDKSDVKTNSSISSPLSVTDSVITLLDSAENSSADVPDKDPLADSEVEDKTEPAKPMTLRTLSFDFIESSTPPSIPDFPFTRQLRKRFRELSPQPTKTVANESKKMKLKGKRQINTSLRKSIEEKKEQQVSSSDEVQIVSVTTPPKKTSKKKRKGKSKKQKQKKIVKSTPVESVEVSDVDETSKDAQSTKNKSKEGPKKDNDESVEQSDEEASVNIVPKQRPKGKNARILAGLEIPDEDIHPTGIRQSRRLAQIKIKEQAEPKKPDSKPQKQEKSKKKIEVKEIPVDKRKRMKEEEPVAPPVPEPQPQDRRKKRKKEKTFSAGFDARKAWQSSSESSEAEEEVEEEEEVIEEYEPPLEFKSDHEFSPESDVASDTEYEPLKRARTARKKQESDQEEEDFPCQKCGKSDHPEWILLCDKCDNGWHCSCLRPPLLNIPEGDWHCPPCEHLLLVENLQKKLEEYDKLLNKKVLEDRRKERLAYVGISLNNVLPSRENEHRKKKRRHSFEESEESVSERSRSSEASDTESDSDEPIYQLRQRRQAKSYKFNEYDELIKSAIQDEVEKIEGEKATQSRGKDIATIIRAEEEERKDNEQAEPKPDAESKPEENPVPEIKAKEYSDDDEPIRPVKRRGRKKGRKMTNLDISSEDDDEKDEDFKGSSSSSAEEEDFEEETDDGSDYVSGKRRKNLRPVRRSTRARVSRFDKDFINDDDEDDLPRKKKKRRNWSESESSDTDGSWAKKKKASHTRSSHTRKRKSRKKNSLLDELSDLEIKRVKPKIKYGGLTSSEEETGRRKTRGKKTTYVDTLGSDSEEERRKRNPHRYIDSDDENDEDFIANEEDDEKDSEEPPEDEKEEEDEEEPQEERRPLIIPKIYIKKPPVSKDILPPHVASSKEPAKPVETPPVEKEKEEKAPEPVIHQNNEIADTENTNATKPPPPPPKIGSITVRKVENLLDPARIPPSELVCIPTNVNNTTTEKPLENPISKIEPKILTREPPVVKAVELTAMEIEQEKKRKALEEAMKLLGPSNSIEIVPIKRGRKPDEQMPKVPVHEPIVDNVDALMHNDESNDELSEPPSVTLPMFEELASKNGTGGVRRKIGKGRPKKTIEEAVANLGGVKKDSPIKVKSESELCIEIAAPPQPFSQASPMPSVITRMLQTSPGQTTAFPVGKIRPKQFATMPADDDEPLPNRSSSGSPQTGPYSSPHTPHMNQFLSGGPRPGPVGQPYGQMPPNMNPYPRGMHPPHQERGSRPSAPAHHMYPPHRMVDPSPRGVPLNLSEPQHPPTTSAPNMKVDSQNYARPRPPVRYPPPSPIRGARPPPNLINHLQQPRPTNMNAYPPHQSSIPSGPPPNYYGDYPPQESLVNEDAMPPRAYQGSPYQEEYSGDPGLENSENSNSKSYGGEAEEGGEFGGLVSYFSSQREDDLDS